MNDGYNVWCKWHPLKTVLLGDCYGPRFFRDIKNDRIRSALTRITEETLEDLSNYEQVLKNFGCKVIRPIMDDNDSIMNYIGHDGRIAGNQGVPRSPLQPRDCQFVCGNKIFVMDYDCDSTFVELLKDYNRHDLVDWAVIPYESRDSWRKNIIPQEKYDYVRGTSWPEYPEYLKGTCWNDLDAAVEDEILSFARFVTDNTPAPCITQVGKDLYVDQVEGRLKQWQIKNFLDHCPDMRLHHLNIGGHSDACFHTLKPGAILSLRNIQNYEKTFPGWDVCYLKSQSWDKVEGFLKMKHKVRGKWWVPGEEDNDEFTNFVEAWLQDWVGYCEESVFDVNVLMLDDRHVCVNNYNETAFAFFKKHHIEPIIVPWRHRYFWDGGLHCITLDLYREGEMEDYFPDREGSIIDEGFNP